MAHSELVRKPTAILIGVMLLFSIEPASAQTNRWEWTGGPLGVDVQSFVRNESGWLFAGTYGGGIYRSTNEGATWTRSDSGITSFHLLCFAICPNGDILAGTVRGLFRSSNNGATWQNVNNLFDPFLVYGIIVDSTGTITVATGSFNPFGGGVFQSTDNGSTWLLRLNAGSYVMSLQRDASGVLFAGVEQSGLYRSSDTGINWVRVNTFWYTLAILCKPNGYVFVAHESSIAKSTDGGTTWVTAGLSLTPNWIGTLACDADGSRFNQGLLLPGAVAIGSNAFLFTATGTRLHRSTNIGVSWTDTSFTSTASYALAFSPSGDLFVGTNGDGVFRSSDYGQNWSQINNGLANAIVQGFTFNSLGHVFAATGGGGVFISRNNGDSWSPFLSGLTNQNVHSLACDQEGVIFAGTDEGVFRTSLSTTSVRGVAGEQPNVFELSPNYPNPFNPSTTIRFQIPTTGFVTLKVFDLLGREVAALIEGKLDPGSYEKKFDASALASGVYIYRCQYDGVAKTRKLLLLR